jgi:hypothetical protein
MNSKSFIKNIQQRLDPIAPIVLPGIIKKQLQEIGVTEDNMTPELAEELIKRIDEALGSFLGPEGGKLIHEIMIKELRRCAPEYFEKQALI